MSITLAQWLREAEHTLAAAGVDSPRHDAQALAQHALGLERISLLTRAQEPLPADAAQLAQLQSLLAQRAQRRPLQHLLGYVDWGGLRLKVDERALIPRPETEMLLQLALQQLAPQTSEQCPPTWRVADVGTGTGALALGMVQARPDTEVWASDLSEQALSLARENAVTLGLGGRVKFVQCDLLSGLDGPFDLIVSNPPYLPQQDAKHAQPEVRHDPDVALYAGTDGLALAYPLAAQAWRKLRAGGVLLLELDPRNASVLAQRLSSEGWQTQLHADLLGRRRFVQAKRDATTAG